MTEKCNCGGNIGTWIINKNNEHIYKDLGSCMDCNKDFLLTINGYKGLSKAEFRRITESRRDSFDKEIPMKQYIKLGVYRHFKGKEYRVLSKGEHTETGETMIIYKALYGEFKIYVRPYNMFVSKVDKVKYPYLEHKNRFDWISD